MTNVLDLLYPPRCAGCGRVDAVWCVRCSDQLDAVALELKPVPAPPLLSICATGVHEGTLQQAVHALKYSNVRALAAPLAARLIAALDALDWHIDLIIPVPLHEGRERARGYNQARLLGDAVAQALAIPSTPEAIARWRDTPPQVGRSRAQREANMSGAFRAVAPIRGAVLLIDDVFTTGATMQACATAARQAGASAVYGLTVSAAPMPTHVPRP
jgi:ComF family protein